MAVSDGRTAGSIFIRVRPDVEHFRKETQDKLGRKPFDMKVKVDADTSEATDAVDDLENETKKKKLQLAYEVSQESVRRARDAINRVVKSLGGTAKVDVDVDTGGVREAGKRIDEELGVDGEKRTIEIEYTEDQDGIRHIIRTLEGVKRAAREVKVGEWDVNPEALDRALNNLRDELEIDIKIDTENLDSFDAAIAQIDRELAKLREIEVSARLSEEDLRDLRATMEYEKELLSDPITIPLRFNPEDADSLDQAIANIDRQLGVLKEVEIAVGTDESSLARAKAQIEAMRNEIEQDDIELEVNVADSGSLRAAMSRLTSELATMDAAKIRVSPDRSSILATMAEINMALGQRFEAKVAVTGTGFAATEAQLQALARDRTIELRARLSGRAMALLEGGFKSLAGINDVDEMVRAFENLIVNFDMIATQAAVMGTAIGSAVNVGTFAVGGLMTVLADASRVVGLLAAAPTAMLAAGAVLQTNKAIWSDFGEALMGIPGVLESMPPHAQEAVKAIEALNAATNQAVQDGFWSRMNDEISVFANEVAPTLTKGMEGVANTYGDTLSGMLDLTTAWVRNGDLGAAFANINRGLEFMGEGAIQAYDAFMTLGLQGSAMFPQLGNEVNSLAIRFNNFVQAAAASGDIARWIQQGVDALSLMTQAGVATVSMLSSLTQAFRTAGMGGLPEFTAGLQRAAEIMRSDVWQIKISNIFEGAIDGARETFVGFKRIVDVIYELDEETGKLLRTIGEVAREAQFLFADMLEQPVLQTGIQDFFAGIRDMLEQLRPAAQSLGDIFGRLGTLAGTILNEMAPGINTLMGIFSDAANALGPALTEAVYPLTTFIDNLGHATRILMGQLLPAVNGVLQAFNALPAFLQNAIALLLVTGKYMAAIGTAAATAFASNRFTSAGAGMLHLRDGARQAGTAVQNLGRYVGAVSFMGLTRAGSGAFIALQGQADTASKRMSTAFSGAFRSIGTAARGFGSVLLGALGGPIGLALIAISTGVAMIASKFGQAKAEAAEFNSEVRSIRDNLMEGNNAQIRMDTYDRLEETLVRIKEVGGETDGILDKLVNGQDVSGLVNDYGAVADAIDSIKNAEFGLGGVMSKLNGDGERKLRADEIAALERLGIEWDVAKEKGAGYFRQIAESLSNEAALHGQANAARRQAREEEAKLGEGIARTGKAARESYTELGAEFATVSEGAQNFASAIQTVGDSSQSADSRVAALGQALQLLSGEIAAPADAGVAAWDSMTAAMSTAESAAQATGDIIGNSADGISNKYEDMSERQKLAIQGVTQVHDSAMAQAVAAYDSVIAAGGSHAEAVEAGKAAYEGAAGQIDQFAEAVGRTDAEIEAIKGSFDNLANSADIELALSMTGMGEQELQFTYDAMARIHAAGLDISNADYVAFLAANPDQAILQVHDLEVVLANFEAQEYMVNLLGDNAGALESIAESVGAGEAYADGSYDAVLKAILDADDLDAASQALFEWDQAQPEATFKTVDEASEFLEGIMPQLESYERTYAADLIENGGATIESTLADLNETLIAIAKKWGIDIDANDRATEKIVPLKDRVDDLGTGKTNIDIDANDKATPKVGPLGATLGSITATPWTTTLDANDGISGPARNAKSAVDNVPPTKGVTLSAAGNVISFAANAVSTIGGMNSKGVTLSAAGNVISFAATAISTIGGMNSKGVILSAAGNVISFASTAIGTIARILGKTISITAVGNALGTLGSIVGLLGNIVSKTVTVTVRQAGVGLGRLAGGLGRLANGASANGNIYPGVSAGKMLRPEKFANGGFSENHTAQISTARTPYRIWAEPETGGEAYIPLAASKRARSTAIWRETGKRLGVYADGGINGGDSGSSGRQIVVNNHYPRAEATSDTIRRAMDYDSMWDAPGAS